jgi:hypothetical protein
MNIARKDKKKLAADVRAHTRTQVTHLERDEAIPGWVDRFLLDKVPDLTEIAVRNIQKRQFNEEAWRKSIEEAIPLLAGNLKWKARQFPEETARRMEARRDRVPRRFWMKWLPCCSEVPIWPFCREDC